eukprot:530508-Prorocentrum_minimum.AAC.2
MICCPLDRQSELVELSFWITARRRTGGKADDDDNDDEDKSDGSSDKKTGPDSFDLMDSTKELLLTGVFAYKEILTAGALAYRRSGHPVDLLSQLASRPHPSRDGRQSPKVPYDMGLRLGDAYAFVRPAARGAGGFKALSTLKSKQVQNSSCVVDPVHYCENPETTRVRCAMQKDPANTCRCLSLRNVCNPPVKTLDPIAQLGAAFPSGLIRWGLSFV